MSKFVMKNRPKKPTEPRHVNYEMGNYLSLEYMQECIDAFKKENPEVDSKDITIEAKENEYNSAVIYLTAPPESRTLYDAKLQTYRIELKAYKVWQEKHKKS